MKMLNLVHSLFKTRENTGEVVGFIDTFLNHCKCDSTFLLNLFDGKYSWHFAHVLQSTFNRGEVLKTLSSDHFVWRDDTGIYYDINGAHAGDKDVSPVLSETDLSKSLSEFKCIPDISNSASNDTDIVTEFIHNFINYANCDYEKIYYQFRCGYCWHFAHILKAVFGRGDVCWAYPLGHMIWVDTNGNPYDIEGLFYGESDYFISEEFLGKGIADFQRIPNKIFDASEEYVKSVRENYIKTLSS